ncbi:MAG TPA: DNA-3-methyladenine glycosylase [Candidatus Dormibacteraeota bacterium]|nr:DNA-3-methyladenine glycosylase [Candidatus Dormibacteraeota bacterium]
MAGPLDREFFARPTVQVARSLLGCRLVVDRGTPSEVVATLVEVEAYLGTSDPASHAYRGPTPRASIMFGAPGHLYVYLSYGVHHCANLVTETHGVAGAVLLRAASVETGEATVRARRAPASGLARVLPPPELLRGPGNLCRGLGVRLGDNGLDVCSPTSRVEVWERTPPSRRPAVVRGPRVGISSAVERPLRFAVRGHPAVSAPRLT